MTGGGGGAEPPKKKRKSRWGTEQVKAVIPGVPTALPANMKEDEQKLYISKLSVFSCITRSRFVLCCVHVYKTLP